ncbi:RHS repeat domain-containing protein [Echinimonas agarilytica]|uniref:Teneurin-like YD-shell domain-containing protein n=1 Tax=Echinimonas agarilytica TaxID=1215918 RepID=A0AA41W3J9_9GAMM|nr:RHS repeat-associated core domain-containing protein [Echinimonas agarilytica]MCM2678171.1 hypothetical protein [Echinimonas agarilytica]
MTVSGQFEYGANRELYHQILIDGIKRVDTLYVKGLYERKKLSSGVTEHKYMVGNVVVTDRSNGDHDTLYMHKDHLGSTASITDALGNIVQHFRYDVWGKQSAFADNSTLANYSSPAESQGFTGHKMMNDLGIIHMNGRIYDPTIGRFLQADPHIQSPLDSQNYNRYSYVLNNPLSFTDPSGFFFKKLKKFVKKYWKAAAAIAVSVVTYGAASGWAAGWGLASTVQIGTVSMHGIAVYGTSLTVTGAMTAGAIAGAAGGFVAGALQTGKLTGALRGAFTGSIAGAVGGYVNHGAVTGWGDAARRVGAAAIGGCGAGKASGGSCSKGARIAAMAQALTIGASEIYKNLSSKYNRTGKPHLWQEGRPDVGKQQKLKLANHYWGASDQAGVMQDLAKGPFMDAFAEFHDGLHDWIKEDFRPFGFTAEDQVSLFATMLPSYAVTLAAAAKPYSFMYSHELIDDRG